MMRDGRRPGWRTAPGGSAVDPANLAGTIDYCESDRGQRRWPRTYTVTPPSRQHPVEDAPDEWRDGAGDNHASRSVRKGAGWTNDVIRHSGNRPEEDRW